MDWAAMVAGRPGRTARQRWQLMVKTVPHYWHLDFPQRLQVAPPPPPLPPWATCPALAALPAIAVTNKPSPSGLRDSLSQEASNIYYCAYAATSQYVRGVSPLFGRLRSLVPPARARVHNVQYYLTTADVQLCHGRST